MPNEKREKEVKKGLWSSVLNQFKSKKLLSISFMILLCITILAFIYSINID